MPDTVVYYHRNCNDGLAAAAVCYRKFNASAEYRPINYGEVVDLDLVKNKQVFIVDFSLEPEEMNRVAAVAELVVCIDHHDTAVRRYNDYDCPGNVELYFDTSRSGAYLTWEYYYQDITPPYAIQLVDDHDRWVKAMSPHTEYFHKQFQMITDVKEAAEVITNPPLVDQMINNGQAVIKFLDAKHDQITAGVTPRVFPLTGDTVPIINLPGFMISDTLNKLNQTYPECLYATGYIALPHQTVFSLRTIHDDVAVNRIAERFGGGGHPKAAGFKVTHDLLGGIHAQLITTNPQVDPGAAEA